MEENKSEIFKGKTFEGLLEDIYKNSKKKEQQIQILITELKPFIKNVGYIPEHVWRNWDESNRPKMVICRKDQLPQTREWRNAWRISEELAA